MLTSKLSFENETNQTRFIDVSIKQIATDCVACVADALNLLYIASGISAQYRVRIP